MPEISARDLAQYWLQFEAVIVFAWWVGPRKKIQAAMANGVVPDEDCPEDEDSFRYWCSTGGKQTDTNKMMLKTSAKVKVSPASTVTQSMLQTTGSEQPQALALPSSDLQRMLEVARGLTLLRL